MACDTVKIDELVLALLYLNVFENKAGARAWKSFNWESMNRLFEKGYISDPRSRAKSVTFTTLGRTLAQDLFKKHFETPC